MEIEYTNQSLNFKTLLDNWNLKTTEESKSALTQKISNLSEIQSVCLEKLQEGKKRFFLESPLQIGKSSLFFLVLL